MEIIFGNKKKKNEITLPTTHYIYKLFFAEILQKIKSFDIEYNYALTNKLKFNNKKLIEKTEKNINYLNILFNEKRTNNYINYDMHIDISGVPIEPSSNQIITTKQNQFVIIINYFETYWIICEIIENWISAGGDLSTVPIEYLNKYSLIKFLNELYKGFSTINKTIIDNKINTFINLLNTKQKKRYYSFEIYSILKKKNLTTNDLEELKKYYDLGIDYTLLDEYKINNLFMGLEKLYTDKTIDTINISDLEYYAKIIDSIHNTNTNTNKKEKINDYYKKYYVYMLNNLLLKSDRKNSEKIFDYIYKLEQINYILTSKQKKRLEIFKLKLTSKHDFNKNNWFPLFAEGELECIKSNILSDPNNVCKIIKKIYPYYKISYDYFCEKINPKTNKKLYDNQDDINNTLNIQCTIMLLIGIINNKLSYTKQDYQIIIKGGKTLQLLLTKIYSKKKTDIDYQSNDINYKSNDIDYKSNDIDLIINPINGIVYEKAKCKILTEDIVNLIKWIFNKNDNPYFFENYIASDFGKDYPDLIKISHKIQKNNNLYHESGFTAIADIDFGEKNHLIYDNLIYDWEYSTNYGKLLYIYQNFNDYLLEKIYYLNYYIGELNKLIIKSKLPNIILTNDEYNNFNNYNRFIDKFSKQIILMVKIKLDENNFKDNVQIYLNDFVKSNNISINIKNIIGFLI